MTSLVISEIKLCSEDVLCPAINAGQSWPRLPMHTLELHGGCGLIAPKSWNVSNPDSRLAVIGGGGGNDLLLSKAYGCFMGNLNSSETDAEAGT